MRRACGVDRIFPMQSPGSRAPPAPEPDDVPQPAAARGRILIRSRGNTLVWLGAPRGAVRRRRIGGWRRGREPEARGRLGFRRSDLRPRHDPEASSLALLAARRGPPHERGGPRRGHRRRIKRPHLVRCAFILKPPYVVSISQLTLAGSESVPSAKGSRAASRGVGCPMLATLLPPIHSDSYPSPSKAIPAVVCMVAFEERKAAGGPGFSPDGGRESAEGGCQGAVSFIRGTLPSLLSWGRICHESVRMAFWFRIRIWVRVVDGAPYC